MTFLGWVETTNQMAEVGVCHGNPFVYHPYMGAQQWCSKISKHNSWMVFRTEGVCLTHWGLKHVDHLIRWWNRGETTGRFVFTDEISGTLWYKMDIWSSGCRNTNMGTVRVSLGKCVSSSHLNLHVCCKSKKWLKGFCRNLLYLWVQYII